MFDDRSPIYMQIADQIKADVLSGTLKGDDQVLSTNQYASFYRINPATVAKAFQQLVDEGILYKRRGVGMFVDPGAGELLHEQHRQRFHDDFIAPMVAEARTIGIPLREIIDQLDEMASEEDE